MTTITPRQAVTDLKARGTAHHAHHGGRTVAFRLQANGRIESRYSDGVIHPDLTEADAIVMAECWLGLPVTDEAPAKPAKPKVPAKRASIPLGFRTGWSVSLRRDEVWPSDPGNGCPAVVCGPFGVSATYWCAQGEGYVSGRDGDVEIPAHIYRKLASQEVEDAVAEYLADCEAYWARIDPTR